MSRNGRVGSGERGFALITALAIAVLYLALIELLLMDGTRAYQEAQRFRSRVVAANLAESAAELAAEQMTVKTSAKVSLGGWQGTGVGEYTRSGDSFELTGHATTAGVAEESADVRVQGRILGNKVVIDYTMHSQ